MKKYYISLATIALLAIILFGIQSFRVINYRGYISEQQIKIDSLTQATQVKDSTITLQGKKLSNIYEAFYYIKPFISSKQAMKFSDIVRGYKD